MTEADTRLAHAPADHPRLAPRKILESPKVGDSIDRQDRRRIIALLLDQLADLRGRPGRQFGHRGDRRLVKRFRVILRRGACLFWFIDIGSLLTSFRNAQPHNYIILLYTSFAGV